MATRIFISYRRDDSAGHAGRVHDRLEREFGRDLLFMDVDAIPLGANFVKVLSEEVSKCDSLLAIIGPGWLNACDEDGNRRLEDPQDFVRIEIGAALERDIPVIPIMLDGTRVPRAHELPDDLKELSLRNGLEIRHASFHADMDKLVRGLTETTSRQEAAQAMPSEAPDATDSTSFSVDGLIDDDPLEELRRIVEGPDITSTVAPYVENVEEAMHRAAGRIYIDAPIVESLTGNWFLPGDGNRELFKDIDGGPEMVVVPAGSFTMGSPKDEPRREARQKGVESPQYEVTIANPFAAGRHAITRGQFAAFVTITGHKTEGGAITWNDYGEWEHNPKGSWRNPGFAQQDSHPVVCINWDDAKAYAAWLSDQTGHPYRLLSEAEWEYVARAGTTSPFWWGKSITPKQANYDGDYTYESGGSKGEFRKCTVPVDSFEANPWGLYQVHGNVWDWCEDVWHDNYNGAPTDGSAWLQGGEPGRRVIRGGSWYNRPQGLRSANRDGGTTAFRVNGLGFRVARTLNP